MVGKEAMPNECFDVVVVGGGSSGCVLASRLSEDPKTSVLLIEAGRDTPPGHTPDTVKDLMHRSAYEPENMWSGLVANYASHAVYGSAAPTGQRVEQARIMGGGSSVNAMAALRGTPEDFQAWVDIGAVGWGYSDVLPYFCRVETDNDFSGRDHGNSGPMSLRRTARAQWPPLTRALTEAAQRDGFRFVEDHNAAFEDGFAPIARMATAMERSSVAENYLTEKVRRRPNLHILADHHVDRVVFEGRRAVGVIAQSEGSVSRYGALEVVICAGALQTPAILMRSGLGAVESLGHHGIDVVADLPGVGRNLQEHAAASIAAYLVPQARQDISNRPIHNAALRLSSNIADCPPSDVMMYFMNKSGWHPVSQRIGATLVGLLKPYSRGVVTLNSRDAWALPSVDFNMLSDPRDMARMKFGLRRAYGFYQHAEVKTLCRAVFPAAYSERVRNLNQHSRANYIKSWLFSQLLDLSGPLRQRILEMAVAQQRHASRIMKDDDLLEAWIVSNLRGMWHPCGTCRMGREDDRLSVVDANGRVQGVGGLRIADASIMPEIPRANTNLTVLMAAEKISDAMKAGPVTG